MKQLEWIAFDYEDFFNDVEGEKNHVIGAYMRFLFAYTKRECAGLPNDDYKLRFWSGCQTDDEWEETKAALFSARFKLEDDGLWHQKRARSEYLIAIEKIEKDRAQRSLAGKASAAKRWPKRLPIPDKPTGRLTGVTATVKRNCNEKVTE